MAEAGPRQFGTGYSTNRQYAAISVFAELVWQGRHGESDRHSGKAIAG